MSDSSPAIQEVWDKWSNDRDNESANQLVEHYLYLVQYHVQRIAIHLPKNVSKDDMKSLGLMGLYDALHKFEPKRDLKFDTYASFRIRGSIIDGLRKEDWLPRSTRDKSKKIDKALRDLEQKLHREPTLTEVAEFLGMRKQEVEEIVKDSLFSNLLSIEEKSSEHQDDYKEGIGYNLPDDKNLTPEDSMLTAESHHELEQSIGQLNKNEQLVISLFYKEELTFTEIGNVLELTTSRISQIHKQAIFKLKKHLA
ncbi:MULTISPECIES: FliA/WhiG family RNA polymerase sigma factor [Paraliobacillus]|uniref:FliA/WhiG family RNA polymerase sigma factor n=1 Tax=Paraliobacillus TaxID=200903 RepID=UPI000DD4AF32|nr:MULTISPECIES: FliA/WhiG family RNA polymerase sigma factor [Paraliobacillus]